MEEIDLKELFGIFWEKKVTILLLTAIFMVVGFIYSSFIVVPEYSSSTTLVLASAADGTDSTTGITTTDITLNSKLISTYSKLVKSKTVTRQVIANLGISEDEEESIRQSVDVTAEENTEILKITVTNENPQKAADIANEMVVVFAEEVKRLYKIDNVNTVDVAEPDEVPSNINHPKTIIIFAAIGFIISAAYIFIIYMLDNSIKSGEDIEKNMDITVLASIPVYEPELKVGTRAARNQKNSKGGKRR